MSEHKDHNDDYYGYDYVDEVDDEMDDEIDDDANNQAHDVDDDVDSEEKLETLMTKLTTLFTIKEPSLLPYLDILKREEIHLKLFQAMKSASYGNRTRLKDFATEIIQSIIPTKFLQKLNEELRNLDNLKSENNLPREANQSLYHLTNDKRMLQIVCEGFKNLDDHDSGTESTGRIERALGLNGIFFMYGRPYDYLSDKKATNLAVFSANKMLDNSTICITGEFSFGATFYGYVSDHFSEEFGLEEIEDGTMAKEFTKKQIMQFILMGLTNILSRVISPTRVINEAGPKNHFEVCVDANKLELPQMIIVAEEPEYFFDEAVAKNPKFAEVPFLDYEAVKTALASVGIKKKKEFLPKFVELVNKGTLNPMDWAINGKV